MDLTKEEAFRQFLKNEEKLWDLAAITAAPTFYQILKGTGMGFDYVCQVSAENSYELADALMKERRRRLGFKEDDKE